MRSLECREGALELLGTVWSPHFCEDPDSLALHLSAMTSNCLSWLYRERLCGMEKKTAKKAA